MSITSLSCFFSFLFKAFFQLLFNNFFNATETLCNWSFGNWPRAFWSIDLFLICLFWLDLGRTLVELLVFFRTWPDAFFLCALSILHLSSLFPRGNWHCGYRVSLSLVWLHIWIAHTCVLAVIFIYVGYFT